MCDGGACDGGAAGGAGGACDGGGGFSISADGMWSGGTDVGGVPLFSSSSDYSYYQTSSHGGYGGPWETANDCSSSFNVPDAGTGENVNWSSVPDYSKVYSGQRKHATGGGSDCCTLL